MTRWIYYQSLALLDLVRLWATTQHHVVIVAGICLPILLLLGLKQGHVTELRRALLTSPTGRQVLFWSAQGGELLDSRSISRLEKSMTGVEIVIPDTQRLVDLSAIRSSGKAAAELVTLYATRSGDPVLRQAGADVLLPAERAVVLTKSVAEKLGVKVGDLVTLSVKRTRGDDEHAATTVVVKRVIPGGSEGAVGYADSKLIDEIEQYVRGFRVAELGWPARAAAVRDAYSQYIIACERTNDLTEDDRAVVSERGLVVEELADELLADWATLLKPMALDSLRLYSVFSATSREDARRRLTFAPSEIAELTQADDVIVAWNPPATRRLGDWDFRLVGLSLPERTWLRGYFAEPELPFDYSNEPFAFRPLPPAVFDDGQDTQDTRLQLDRKTLITLQRAESQVTQGDAEAAADQAGAIAIVPATLLAYLDAFDSHRAEWDPQLNLFVPVPEPPVYDKARLYARTIDDVPSVASALANKGFAVLSESGRIAEIHDQDHSLYLLVVVVGAGVFLFGVVTVVSVLQESTDRKRGTIGILRVMGVSRLGVFYLVVSRACAIGLLAGALSAGCGYLIALALGWSPPTDAAWLQWKPRVAIVLLPRDIAIVFVGALACSACGALIPAWKASRLDPFDAIVEGRFR